VPQVAGGARFGFAPGPSAQGVVLAFVVSGGDQSVLLELTTFGYPVATEIPVILGVILLGKLALAIPLVVGVALSY